MTRICFPHCRLSEKQRQLSPNHLAILTVLSMAATVVLMLFMSNIDSVLTSSEPGYDIIDFELAFTTEKASQILESWEPYLQETRKSLYIDFGYLVAYALFLSSLATLVTFSLVNTPQRIGRAVAVMPWMAALLDSIENACLLYILSVKMSGVAVFLAGACASVKFLLVGIVFAFLIVGGVYVLTKVGRARLKFG
jgi:hypothetical protein